MKHPKQSLQTALDKIAKGNELLAEVAQHPDVLPEYAGRIEALLAEIVNAEHELAELLSEMPEPPPEPWKPGPQARAILTRIGNREGFLELVITATGGRYAGTYRRLVAEGYVERYDHPEVQSRGYPAPACRLTDKGRQLVRPA